MADIKIDSIKYDKDTDKKKMNLEKRPITKKRKSS